MVPACTSVNAVVPIVVVVFNASSVVVSVAPLVDEELAVDPKLKTNPSGAELLAETEELSSVGAVS